MTSCTNVHRVLHNHHHPLPLLLLPPSLNRHHPHHHQRHHRHYHYQHQFHVFIVFFFFLSTLSSFKAETSDYIQSESKIKTLNFTKSDGTLHHSSLLIPSSQQQQSSSDTSILSLSKQKSQKLSLETPKLRHAAFKKSAFPSKYKFPHSSSFPNISVNLSSFLNTTTNGLQLKIVLKWPSYRVSPLLKNKDWKLDLTVHLIREGARPDTSFSIPETHTAFDHSIPWNKKQTVTIATRNDLPVTYNSVYRIGFTDKTNPQNTKYFTTSTVLCLTPTKDHLDCTSNQSTASTAPWKSKHEKTSTILPPGFEIPSLQLLCLQHKEGDNLVEVKVTWPPIEDVNYNYSFSNGSVASREEMQKNATVRLRIDYSTNTDVTNTRPHTLFLNLNQNHHIHLIVHLYDLDILYKPLEISLRLPDLETHPKCPLQLAAATVAEKGHTQTIVFVMVAILLMSLLALSMVLWSMRMMKKKMVKNDYKAGFTKTNSYKSNASNSLKFLRESVSTNGSNNTATTGVDEWEVDPDELILNQEIGHGAFGRVICGWYRKKMVAVKVLKETIPNLYREELLREIALLKGMGSHPNIVSILGASTIKDPIALIMEYVPFGDMHSFLRRCKNNFDWKVDSKELVSTHCMADTMTGVKEVWQVTSKDLVSWGRQIALAMEYLAGKQYVHRDLAARNILMASNKTVMLCDFGLARLIYKGDNHYFRRTNCKLPLRWMAIESIRDRLYTSKSDVWSFGVLLWEISTFGCTPYENIPIVDLYKYLVGGYRMKQPYNCSNELYQVMTNCWKHNPEERPTFSNLRLSLEVMLSKGVEYLDLDVSSPTSSPLLSSNRDGADKKAKLYNVSGGVGNENIYNDTSEKNFEKGFIDKRKVYKDFEGRQRNGCGNEMMYTNNGSYQTNFQDETVSANRSETLPRLVKSRELNMGRLGDSYNSKIVKNSCYGVERDLDGVDDELWHRNNLKPHLSLPLNQLLSRLNSFKVSNDDASSHDRSNSTISVNGCNHEHKNSNRNDNLPFLLLTPNTPTDTNLTSLTTPTSPNSP